MEALHKLEDQLAGVFKGMPGLSASAKETLASVWPWLALLGGIVQLWAAWALYDIVRFVERINTLFYSLTGTGLSSTDRTLIYLGVAMLVIDAVILLVAFPELRKRSKRGWDLVFLSVVLNVGYAIVQLFTHDRGVASFLGNLVGSFLAFYLLFQVREKFGGAKVMAAPAPKK